MTYDAAVIGAGHNGLVCAAYLARAGKRVAVFERRHLVGGSAVTEEVFPGCRVSRLAYVNSLFRMEIVRDLNLKSYGLEFLPREPSSFSPFPDDTYLMLGSNLEQNQKEISKFSPRDAERLPAYEEALDTISQWVETLWDRIPPDPLSNRLRDLWTLGNIARKLRKSGPLFLRRLTDLFSLSAADFLDRWFESGPLKATLATDGVIGAMAGPFTPGTAYVLLHHVMGETDGKRGLWCYIRGGMGALSQSIAMACDDLGVDIRTETPVERIAFEGEARGVILTTGETVNARVVVSSADPHVTFLNLLPEEALPGDFRRSIQEMDFKSAVAKMNLRLTELPEFTAIKGKGAGPQHRGTIHICPSLDYLERAYDDAKYGMPSREPFLECTIPTSIDDSLAPAGTHLMGIFCQYAPYRLRGSNWDREKEPFANRIIDTVTRYAPNFRRSIEDYELLLPPDMERIFGLTGGNIFHGSMTLNQLFFMRPVLGWSNYRTPVRRLYLCGSGAHPGGGVTGAPGRNASRVILRDLAKLR
ncbi:MAG: phytoene desaturase family protein [Fidelibacterota bacterium]